MGNIDSKGYSRRRLTLLAGLIGGLGGNSPDLDHFIGVINQNQALWAVLHQPLVAFILLGGIIASIGGLVISLVLKRRR